MVCFVVMAWLPGDPRAIDIDSINFMNYKIQNSAESEDRSVLTLGEPSVLFDLILILVRCILSISL